MSVPLIYDNEVIGDYTIITILGNGAFGSVYKVKGRDGTTLALKCFFASRFEEVNGKVGQLVKNEVEALKKISSPYVIKLYAEFHCVYKMKEIFCIVLEYCDGGDLQGYLTKNWLNFTKEDAISFFSQLLNGMRELHRLRIIHRDLKLPNILVHGKQIKIADFGFCHILKPGESRIGWNLGSLGTQAPEVMNNELYGLKSDMFSVGVIFYLMLFGRYPFSTESEKQFQDDVRNHNPPSYNINKREIDLHLQDLLTLMLKERPEDRLDWPDLFRSRLFDQKISMLFQTSMIELQQSIINPVESYLFYKQQPLQPNYELLESKPILKQQEAIQSQDLLSQINWLLLVHEQIYKVHHLQIRISLFPFLLLLKLTYEKQLQWQKENKINNTQQQSNFDLSSTYNNLTTQQQTVAYQQFLNSANYERLENTFVKTHWFKEITCIRMSENFKQIFQEAILKYISDLMKEIDLISNDEQLTLRDIWSIDQEANVVTKEILEKIKLIILLVRTLKLQEIDSTTYRQQQFNDATALLNQYIHIESMIIQNQ